LPLRTIQPRSKWLPAIDKFIHIRRHLAYSSMPLNSGPFVSWLLKSDCELLGNVLDLQLDDVTEIFRVACPTKYVWFLPDKVGIPDDHIPSNNSQKKKRPKHREFTDTVTQAISSSRLTCIITDGLDAFSGSCPRLKRFLQRLESLICFIHIFTMVPSSVRSISGPGFACGTLADGRYYASLHSHGLLAQTPSLKVEMLFASFKQLHNNNHAPVKKTRSL
jgi:hypothetical protein